MGERDNAGTTKESDAAGFDLGGEAFESVLRAAAAGADWAWRLLVEHYSGPLLGYLRLRVSNDPEAALSETWMSAASTIGGFSGDEPSFRSWLFVIAHRRAIDAARQASRRPTVVETPVSDKNTAPDISAEARAITAISTEQALDLLATLTPDQRSVIALRVIADLSLEETARIVDKRVGAVKALQKRGLERLRRTLGEQPFPPEPNLRLHECNVGNEPDIE